MWSWFQTKEEKVRRAEEAERRQKEEETKRLGNELMKAATAGNIADVEALLRQGVDIEYQDHYEVRYFF
jgi:hypothetical protein